MAETADIVIIGGGIMGMCVAFQLSRRTNLKIIVLDKGAGPGEGSTGASSAVCRYKYTRSQMVVLARDGINAYRNWSDFLDADEPIAKFHADGVLWLADGNPDWPAQEVERLGSFGVRAAVLDDNDLRERFPDINPCILAPDLETGRPHACKGGGRHFLEIDGGYMDPVDALQDLITASRARGVDVRFGIEATAVHLHNAKISGVTLGNGQTVACNAVVNAAGPWCRNIFDAVGLNNPWPLKPTRIQIVYINRPPEVKGHIPVCVDLVGGIYFRTQNRGQQIVVGSVSEEDEKEVVPNPDDYAKYVDDGFTLPKLHALGHRIPTLEIRGGIQGYSGLYTINQADVHPIVGATPIDGFYVVNGFSGHGFKLAPAIGSLLAQEITGDKATAFDTDVDRSFLAFDRKPIQIETKSVLA